MTQNIRSISRHITVFGAALLVLWLLFVLSAWIPNEAIRENMVHSANSYSERNAFEFTKDSRMNTVADHYADAIWLNIAWNMGVGDPVTASIRTNYYDGKEQGENAGLYYTVTEGTAPNTDYTRYWHGTAMFIRFLSLITDVEGIKAIGFAAFLLLVALSTGLLGKLGHWDLGVLLLLSLAAVQVWNIRLSMEYQPAFLVAFLLIPLYLMLERQGNQYLTYLSVIGGVAVAFFDFLTTETVTILLPLVLVTAVRAKEGRLGSFRQELPLLAQCGVSWGTSYIGAFLVKWTAASLVTGANAFSTAFDSVSERVSGDLTGFAEQPDSFMSAPLANLNMLFGGTHRVEYGRILLGLGLCILLLFSVWYLLRGKRGKAGSGLLLSLGGIVLVRYLVLNNHSYLHCFFTYRALVTLIFAALAAVWLNIALPQKKGGRR